MHGAADRAGAGILVVDADRQVAEANGRARDLLDRDPTGSAVADVLPGDLVDRLPTAGAPSTDGGQTSAAAAAGEHQDLGAEYFPGADRWLAVSASPGPEDVVLTLSDVSRFARRQRALERRREELELLSRLNGLVQSVLGAIVAARSREDVEAELVEGLAATDVFDPAWVATAGGDGTLSAAAVAGDNADLLEDLTGADVPSPERAALRAGDPAVVDEVVDSENVPEGLRRAAFARGVRSAAAVPLSYGDTTYGVLGVYSVREGGLAKETLTGLRALGQVGGFAVNATRTRQTLRSATRRELDLRFEATDSPLAALAARLDAAVTLEGTASPDPDRLLVYVTLSDVDPAAAVAAAEDCNGVDHVRLVAERDRGARLELRLDATSPLVGLVDHGATVATATAADGELSATVQLARAADVRDLLEALERRATTVDLEATRTTEAVATTAADVRAVYREELTDRQRLALRTAANAGYFESPRESTAEELAESIGVSSPTFHHHLRAAHRKLLAAVLADDPETATGDDAQ